VKSGTQVHSRIVWESRTKSCGLLRDATSYQTSISTEPVSHTARHVNCYTNLSMLAVYCLSAIRHARMSLKLCTLLANITEIAGIIRKFHWNCGHYSQISLKLWALLANITETACITREYHCNCGHYSRISLKLRALFANITATAGITREYHWNCGHYSRI
jgi:hypothetical protein